LYNEEESKYCEVQGGKSFFEVSLPVAELKLRQGFGRLMRSKNDGGVVLITDNRFYTKQYGTQLQASLPKCSRKMDTIKNIIREMHAFFDVEIVIY
jgi:ATP-dependent DNA helicase DinG